MVPTTTDARPGTVIAAARAFWREFLPIWACPVAMFSVGLIGERLDVSGWTGTLLFGLPVATYFLWASVRAARVWLAERIRYRHFAFWVVLAPLLLWVAVVFSRTAIQRWLRGS